MLGVWRNLNMNMNIRNLYMELFLPEQYVRVTKYGSYHVGVTNVEKLDLYPLIKYPDTDMSMPGIQPRPPTSQAVIYQRAS
jgi:hypothetical protein